jgi:hypothetical protein
VFIHAIIIIEHGHVPVIYLFEFIRYLGPNNPLKQKKKQKREEEIWGIETEL